MRPTSGLVVFYRSISDIIHSGPLPRQCRRRSPFPSTIWAVVFVARSMSVVSHVYGLELVDKSKRLHELRSFLSKFWLGQLIVPKAAFLLSFSHALFLLLVCARHSINTYLVDCRLCMHGHSGMSNPGTFLECNNFLRPVFFRPHL